jgi:hypothetical protein
VRDAGAVEEGVVLPAAADVEQRPERDAGLMDGQPEDFCFWACVPPRSSAPAASPQPMALTTGASR